MVLQNADGECRSEVFHAHTLRHAANAAEVASGELAVAVTPCEPRSKRIRIIGRCVMCGDMVLEIERWQRPPEGLRCEDCRR